MKKYKNLFTWVSESFVVLLGSLFVLLPISPANAAYSYRDSGVFLYMGWRILHGEVPYIHVWDHKPPVIYYLNALGLGLANNSVWGVWVIQLLFLFTATFIGYKLLKGLFGLYPAIVSTFTWLLALVFIIQGGNLTTAYTLPLQFGALFLFFLSLQKTNRLGYFLAIGIFGGLAFFTKQTVISIWLAIILITLFQGIKHKTIRRSLFQVMMIIAGYLLMAVIFFGYFYYRGALGEFWDAAFLYNFAYSIRKVSGLNARLLSIFNLSSITKTGIFHLSAVGVVIFLFLFPKKVLDARIKTVLSAAVIALPLEILLINAPGTTFPHYFMSIFPILALFTGLLFYVVMNAIEPLKKQGLQIIGLTLLTIGLLFSGSFIDYRNNNRSLQGRINEPAIQYILERTAPDDMILVWGAETMVNFYARRVSPTRFVYQYPLYRIEYTTEEMVTEFLDDIIANQPKLIFNSWGKHAPIFVFPVENEAINQKLDYIKSIYVVVDGVNSWQVFQLSVD